MGLAPAHSWGLGLAWVTLCPFWWVALRSRSLGAAMATGLLWGFAYHGTALSWIWGLHPMTWMGIPWNTSLIIAIAAWAIVSLWGALIPMMVAIALHWMRHHQYHPVSRIWIGVSLWCGLEWIWTQSPLWWTALSYTQSPSNRWILHLGQLSGPTLVSAILVGVNALWAEAYFASTLIPSGRHRSNRWKTQLRRWRSPQAKPFWISAIALILSTHLLGWGLTQHTLTSSPETEIKIGIIQGNIPTRIKLFSQGLSRAFQDYQAGYESLAQTGADAVLMPEGAFPVKWEPNSSQYQPLLAAIEAQNIPAWIGAFMPTGDRITQSLVTVTPTQFPYSQYDKVKLVPLGEYLPFEKTLGQLVRRLTPLSYRMIPGATNQTFATPFGQAIVSICYDSAFPQLFREQARKGGQFILSVANNDPYSARMMAQHHAQDVMRAIETDRWVARATNTGFSSVIDPQGQTHWRSQRNRYETHLGTIHRRDSRTPYVRWGSWFLGLQIIASFFLFVQKIRPSHFD